MFTFKTVLEKSRVKQCLRIERCSHQQIIIYWYQIHYLSLI